jgi:CheY-like chemotaxis protein
MGEQPNWILVLEDDPVQSAIYEKILRAGRYQVTAIPDPLDFVNSLDSLPVPTAILLDIVLPGMDGVTVLEHLERHPLWCMVPVIMMTASPTRDRVSAAQKLPVPPEGFVVKPVDPQGLLQMIRAVVACQEPIYALRNLQRKRLALRASLSGDVVDIEKSLSAADDICEECSAKMAEARKEIQSLHVVQGQLRDRVNPQNLGVQERIRELEELIEARRKRMDEAAAGRRTTLRRRQDILVKQKAIRELDLQIRSLAFVLTRGKGLDSAASADGVALGEITPPDPSELLGASEDLAAGNGTDP